MSPLRLPPHDRERSWHTGYARQHWEAVADHLLDAVVPHGSPDFAQFHLPGRQSWSGRTLDGLEGFARTFLLAGFRIAGARGAVAPELIERYASGLAAGTDPAHPFAWPALTSISQQLVEAASIALTLHETRQWIYDRLPAPVQERVVDWLAGFVGKRTFPCNWVLFQVIVEQFLASVGGPHDPAEIKAGLADADEWYVGNGWYTDGPGQNYDYYIGWAMHLYTVLWARMAGAEGAMETYRERLRPFLEQYQYFFASNGSPVHQGRSLTYRFAAAAPLWLGELCGASPLAPGLTRRLASGTLRHFVERGAPGRDGLLSLGWHHPFLPVTQPYSGPASPYWASKGFLGLLLPPDHPVWTDREATSPVDDADRVLAIPESGWLLHSTRHDGIVRLVNHGSDHSREDPDGSVISREDPHYAKFGYSTHCAPEAGEAGWQDNVDGHLAVIAPDGTVSRRRLIERVGVHDRFAASQYTDGDAGGITVRTASVVKGPWEVRVHRVFSPDGYEVREGGYALADEAPPEAELAPGYALVTVPGGLNSAVIGLYGWTTADVSRLFGNNAFGPCSATPHLRSAPTPYGVSWHVSLVALSGDPIWPQTLAQTVSASVDADAEQVVVEFPDGEVVEVRLGATDAGYVRRGPTQPPVSWRSS